MVFQVWLGGTALCDIVITVSMTYYLWRVKIGARDSYNVIIRLISMTVETGFLCAITATIELVMFVAFPHNNAHVAPGLALSKLYSNSLFAVSPFLANFFYHRSHRYF
jgi:hypothetical protein